MMPDLSVPLTVLGLGSLTEVHVEWALAAGFTIGSLHHYRASGRPEQVAGIKTDPLPFPDLLEEDIRGRLFLLTMGDIPTRRRLADLIRERGGRLATVVHPSAFVAPSARIGEGVTIGPLSHVGTACTIGRGTCLSHMVNISHHTAIGADCYLALGATVGAHLRLGEATFVGMNATLVSDRANTGPGAFICAGAVVVKDVAPGEKRH